MLFSPATLIPLTVVVATTQAWPELQMCLDSLRDQAAAQDVEILIVDGHGGGLPDAAARRYPGVRRIAMIGASVLQMRAHAMAQARGEIVATTEDHCRVAPDWCRRIIEAHRDFPDAAVIGGVVENGADRDVVDWAAYFVSNGAAMPPVRDGECRSVAGQATVSYKRQFIPAAAPAIGRMEWMLNRDLRRQGHTLVADNRIRVEHVQPVTFAEACALHYHDSRSIAGFRLESIGWPERLLRLGVCFAMPPLLFARTVFPILRKRRHWDWLALSAPMIAVLVCCRAAGALVGFLSGVGESPLRIR
jgi:hypothetical protein